MIIALLVLIVLLMTAGLVMLAKIARQQKLAIAALRAEEEAIVAEERRMFHYLHDLGEAIWRDDQQASMYLSLIHISKPTTAWHGCWAAAPMNSSGATPPIMSTRPAGVCCAARSSASPAVIGATIASN